jgi:ubiquinone/menaquinone biosynthesis C-methylase UbiE
MTKDNRSVLSKIIERIKWALNCLLYGNPHGHVLPAPPPAPKKKEPPPIRREDPTKYSTMDSKGRIVPVQIEAYFLALNRYVEEGDDVLDVGFGLGYGLNILAIKAKTVSGVDVDKQVYDYCQGTVVGRNPRLAQLSVYDGMHLPFDDNSYDVITCVDVLEHVLDYDGFLDELLRVTRKGILISTPNRRPEYTNVDGTPRNPWHRREWSHPELDEILKRHVTKVDWNFLNGVYEGPFTCSQDVEEMTQTLTPFLYKATKISK